MQAHNLPDTHVSLLKKKADNSIIKALEGFVLKKLRRPTANNFPALLT